MKKTVSPTLNPLPNARQWMVFAVFMILLWFVFLCIFYLWPEIDIAFSKFFFEPQPCIDTPKKTVHGSFPMAHSQLCIIMRKFLIYLPIFSATFLLILSIKATFHRNITSAREKSRRYNLTLLALLVGPGLFVNLFLKTFSGRPRPYQTDLFCGFFSFEPAGSFAGPISHNCSFISGEAAAASWLLSALTVLLSPKQRAVFVPIFIITSLATAFLRVGFGGHYLSDVILGLLASPTIMAVIFAIAKTLRYIDE